MIDKIIENEIAFIKNNFNLDEVIDFTIKHRVEILRGADYGYECYIDYKEGVPSQGFWASELTPLSSLIIGIKEYKSRNI